MFFILRGRGVSVEKYTLLTIIYCSAVGSQRGVEDKISIKSVLFSELSSNSSRKTMAFIYTTNQYDLHVKGISFKVICSSSLVGFIPQESYLL